MTEQISCHFCPAPFLSLQLNAFGTVGVCPKSAGLFQFSDNSSLKDKWTSNEMENLRSRFLNGEKPQECFRCWTEENANVKSLRQVYLDQLPEKEKFFEDTIKSKTYLNGPETFVIQVGNYCNYSCRTCHAIDSSAFNNEGNYYAKEYDEVKNRYRRLGSDYSAITDNRHISELTIKQYSDIGSNIKRVEFFGGEPFLNKTHLELLKNLIDSKRASEISLFYSTNGSFAPTPEMQQLWPKFKYIHISMSLDGARSNYNYIRYPGEWKNVRISKRWFDVMAHSSMKDRFFIDVNLTVSILNIFNLPQIYKDIESDIRAQISYHLVINPSYYSISNIPSEIKEVIIQRLNESSYAKQFHGIVKYLQDNEANPTDFEHFVIWTVRKDLYRKQSFAEVFPEYYSLLKPYFDKFGTNENIYKRISTGVY